MSEHDPLPTSVTVEQKQVICWCGITFMVPQNLYRNVRDNVDRGTGEQKNIYCPLGHAFSYGAREEVKKLRDQLAKTQGQLDQTRARAYEAEAKVMKVEKKLKRVAKGTCPECKRHFVNVERHMKSKHARALA